MRQLITLPSALVILLASLLLISCRPHPEKPAPATEAEPTVEVRQNDWSSETISGWAWDSARPGERLRVEIHADDKLLTTIVADEFREDLKTAGKGDGKHGLTFPIPTDLRNGKQHSFRLSVTGGGAALGDPPRTFVPAPVGNNP